MDLILIIESNPKKEIFTILNDNGKKIHSFSELSQEEVEQIVDAMILFVNQMREELIPKYLEHEKCENCENCSCKKENPNDIQYGNTDRKD